MHGARSGFLALVQLGAMTGSVAGQANPPTLRPSPELVIDGGSSSTLFTAVAGACTLPNRTLVTLTDATNLRLWTLSGELLQSVGRSGSGPGEFRQAITLGCRADGFWVFDRALSRITSFDTAGRLVRTQPVYRTGMGVLLPDRTTAVLPVPGYRVEPSGIVHLTFSVARVSSPRDSGRFIFATPTYYRVLNVPVGEMTKTGPQPFDDGGLWAFSSDGSTFAFVERTVGSRTYQVTVAGWQGDTLLHKSYPYTPVRLPRDVVEKEARFRHHPPNDPPELLRAIRKALFTPRYAPTVSRVAVGRDGSVWLRREDVGGETIRWTVLESTGDPRMEVVLPRDFGVLEASETAVLGFLRDSDHVPSIVRFRLIP